MASKSSTTSCIAHRTTDARQANYIAFLHRVPFALDAFRLGFVTGFREDCSYQQQQFLDCNLPVGMLDNNFRNPDLERYVDRFFEYEPQVGVIGDAYEVDEVGGYVAAAREIQASYPEAELVIVPKCRQAIDAVPEDLIVGYSRGYADRLAHDFSDPVDWRGRRVHILGGSPTKQLNVIDQLTCPTLAGDPPADIVGLDWNGLHRGAQFGEFWTTEGWDDSGRDAEFVTVRKTVRHGLGQVRKFWETQGVWPESQSREGPDNFVYNGPVPTDLTTEACADCETNVWKTERGPYVAEYDTGTVCGYCSYDCYFTHRHQNNLEELDGEQSVYIPSV
ncbi:MULTISPECIES: DUF6610 family protein [unclassified Haloferax]|uniref:DUF6610 family protein n=1 Tax=unclassified Haloferax TaxID=2625095 RepID=UPI0028750A8E|nr:MULTISPECIES: DUF6610 family protein [unclassified Haloferax]MDS0243764.1 hypothetical protein [Haloferax sp. S2CR25]MDS0446885.1 hypothetical protein [Haloferax sp. S2CR25-2]